MKAALNNNSLFEQFLRDDNNDFDKLEYDDIFLESLINQNPMLLDAKVDNSTLIQQIFDIKKNEKNGQSNIFHPESFIQANKTIQDKEINEYNSDSDTEMGIMMSKN